MTTFFTRFFLLAFSLVFSTQSIFAADDLPSENVIDVQEGGIIYMPSKVIESFTISYPASARRNKVEGYTEVSYDLNEKGKPFNLRFTRSSGIDIFETLIEKKFDKWKFEPATLNGIPIVQKNLQYFFTFSLTKLTNKYPEPLMRRQFALFYKAMRQQLKEESYEKLRESLAVMEKANIIRFSENRQLWLLRYTFLNKVDGSINDKINALQQALKDTPRVDKTKKLHSKIKSSLFKLHVENKQYIKAYSQYYDLRESEFSDTLIDDLAESFEHVKAVLASDESLDTTIRINGTELLTHYLSRRMFKIGSDQDISFMELRCGEFNVQLKYTENALYQMPFDWDNCGLVLRAPEGTLVNVKEAAIQNPL